MIFFWTSSTATKRVRYLSGAAVVLFSQFGGTSVPVVVVDADPIVISITAVDRVIVVSEENRVISIHAEDRVITAGPRP